MAEANKKLSDVLTDNVEKAKKATDKLKVTNISDKQVCLTSGILQPGSQGIATRAELGTLWESLKLTSSIKSTG